MLTTNAPTSVADRIRSATDAEMANIIAECCIDVIANVLKSVGCELNQDTERYANIIMKQLQLPTTEHPRVYTVDEMKAMRGQMVYVHYIGPCHGFYADEYMPFYGNDEIGIKEINEVYSRLHMPLDLYNKSWIALAYKPNETMCCLD